MSKSPANAPTLVSQLEKLAKERPNKDAVVFYNEDLERSSLTYLELYTLASRFAKILKDAGVQKGEYVVCALPNCLEAIVSIMGTNLAGAVSIAVEIFLSTGDTFFEVMDKTQAKYLIVANGKEDLIWKLMENVILPPTSDKTGNQMVRQVKSSAKTSFLKKAIVVSRPDPEQRCSEGFLGHLRSLKQSFHCPDVTADDLSAVYSTASDKSFVCLVAQTHGSVMRAGESSKSYLRGEKDYLINKPNTWITCTPADFLVWGTTRVALDRWSPLVKNFHELLAGVIEKEKIQMMYLLPADVEQLLEKWKPRPLPMLDHLVVAGLPVNEKTARRIKPAAKALTIRYISTQVQGVCYNTIFSADEFHDFDSGILEEGVQVRTVDDDFRDLEPGKIGLLLFKTPGMFHHFVGQPAEDTASKFTSDGWFTTGDAGCQREDGHLVVMGRRDDMILHNIWNVHPSWLEKSIKTHKDVEKVTVVPIPDEDNFHNICACVIKKPGSDLTEEDVKSHFRSNYIEEEKDSLCPSDVLFLDTFPEARPGQVDRKKLAELATELVFKARLAKGSMDIVKNILSSNKV